jgi:hypothetical protein
MPAKGSAKELRFVGKPVDTVWRRPPKMRSKMPAEAGSSETHVNVAAVKTPADTRQIMLPLRVAIAGP